MKGATVALLLGLTEGGILPFPHNSWDDDDFDPDSWAQCDFGVRGKAQLRSEVGRCLLDDSISIQDGSAMVEAEPVKKPLFNIRTTTNKHIKDRAKFALQLYVEVIEWLNNVTTCPRGKSNYAQTSLSRLIMRSYNHLDSVFEKKKSLDKNKPSRHVWSSLLSCECVVRFLSLSNAWGTPPETIQGTKSIVQTKTGLISLPSCPWSRLSVDIIACLSALFHFEFVSKLKQPNLRLV